MFKEIKDRWGILKLTLPHPAILSVFGMLQAAWIIIVFFVPGQSDSVLLLLFLSIPWYAWVIGWLALLWAGSIEYSLKRKENFDTTSLNFFKAFLDFLVKEGHVLYQRAEEKEFYSKIDQWQRKVVQGIAIGLGPRESEKYFEKMDTQYSLTKAYRESQASGSNEPLCRILRGSLEELSVLRTNLTETQDFEREELEDLKKANLTIPPARQLPPGKG